MANKAGTALLRRLQSAQAHDSFDVNIFLSTEPAIDHVNEMLSLDDADAYDAESAVDAIQAACESSQKDLMLLLQDAASNIGFQEDFLDAGPSLPQVSGAPESFWINNSIGVSVSRDMLDEVMSRDDVVHVELTRHVDIAELIDAPKKKKAVRKKKARTSTARRKATDRASTRSKKKTKRSTRAAAGADAFANNPTWSVKLINAPLMWSMKLTGRKVLVAVLDTGTNYKHPDLRDHMWNGGSQFPNHGYDFENNDKDPMDDHGHGTSTAGQVAGDGREGRTTGVAPEATIMAVKVGGQERSFWRGFEFAIKHKAHVISMSMSWKYPWNPDYPGWRRACETVLAAGLLHANSIGNQGSDLSTYPIPYNIATPGNCPSSWLHPLQTPQAGLSSPVSCGATDDSDQLASYSGRGPAAWEITPYVDYPYSGGARPGLIKPDVCAPGPGTSSCNWRYPQLPDTNPYSSFGGTSAATPHVGGCLALLAQACLRSGNPIVPARVQEALENTAVRVAGQTVDKESHYGAGRVDVYSAFKYGVARGWWA